MSSLFKSPKAPKPVDAGTMINAQTEANIGTANRDASYNRVNQVDQYGNTLKWEKTGTNPDGTPMYTARQQLGQMGQDYSAGLYGLGQRYFQGANDLLSNRPDMSSNAAFDRAYGYATANLDPRFDQQRGALEARLRNQGLDPNSEAYTKALNNLSLQHNEARNNLVTNIQGQLWNQGMQDRQQQVGELQSLTQPGMQFGQQVLNPNGNYAQVPGVNVGTVDAMGAYKTSFDQQNEIYKQQMQQQNALLGGLGGLGGTLLGLPMGGGMSLGGSLFKSAFPSLGGLGGMSRGYNPYGSYDSTGWGAMGY